MHPNNYYQILGILPWEQRQLTQQDVQASPVTEAILPAAVIDIPSNTRQKEPDQTAALPTNLDSLKTCVAACMQCALHQSRTQTVFGVGNPQAKLMIIGEAPGFNEDQQGEPFVGAAGQLLTKMIQAMGMQRNDVYIANILKCRPPNNRDPLPEEVATCTAYLDQQINLIKPALLLAVGKISAHYLLKTKSSLESLRGKIHHYKDTQTPLIVTYHPAYLLRTPADKKKAWVDLQFVMQTLKTNEDSSCYS